MKTGLKYLKKIVAGGRKRDKELEVGKLFIRATALGSSSVKKTPILRSMDNDEYVVEPCEWDISDADLCIATNGVLFPVHRSFVALESPILRGIIVTVGQHDEMATIISIGGYSVNHIRLLLDYIYNPQKLLSEQQLKTYLFLAEEFMIPELRKKCERVMMMTKL